MDRAPTTQTSRHRCVGPYLVSPRSHDPTRCLRRRRSPPGNDRRRRRTLLHNMQYQSNSEQETKEISKKIAATLHGGDIVLLYGELGAGKSTFTRGIAEYFNINETVTSPTFTLMNIYPIESNEIKQLVHIDTYRLDNEQQLIEIGAEDYLGTPNTICFIEWPEKIEELLKNKKTISVKIVSQEENKRQITVSE